MIRLTSLLLVVQRHRNRMTRNLFRKMQPISIPESSLRRFSTWSL
jgi:hypothetical protein